MNAIIIAYSFMNGAQGLRSEQSRNGTFTGFTVTFGVLCIDAAFDLN